MNLRIYRTFTWKFDPTHGPMRIGGDNPMKLVAHDRLQYSEIDGQGVTWWLDVPVAHEPAPPHPMRDATW